MNWESKWCRPAALQSIISRGWFPHTCHRQRHTAQLHQSRYNDHWGLCPQTATDSVYCYSLSDCSSPGMCWASPYPSFSENTYVSCSMSVLGCSSMIWTGCCGYVRAYWIKKHCRITCRWAINILIGTRERSIYSLLHDHCELLCAIG
jgi:hypothetical protein